jgi:hypothetical protein
MHNIAWQTIFLLQQQKMKRKYTLEVEDVKKLKFDTDEIFKAICTRTAVPESHSRFSPGVRFENRQEAVADIKRAYEHNANMYKKKKEDYSSFSILFAIGGSGAGKTRVADEIPSLLRQQGGVFANTQEVYMNFGYGEFKDRREPDRASSFIGIRLCSGGLRGEWSSHMFDDIGTQAYDWAHAGVFEPDLVIKAIGTIFREMLQLAENTLLPIVFIFDEAQGLKMNFEWANILIVIRNMCENQHQVLVIPIIVGTIPRNDIPDVPGCNNIFLHLPPLEPEHVRNVLASENLTHMTEDPKLLHFWNQMGIVPRNLENAIYFTDEKYLRYHINPDLITATQEEVFSLYHFKPGYPRYTNDDVKLLSYVFSGTKISINNEWFNSIMRLGYIFSTREGQVYIPHFIFERLMQRRYTTFASLLPQFHTIVEDRVSLVCATLVTRVRCLVEYESNLQVCICQLFPGITGYKHTFGIKRLLLAESDESFITIKRNRYKIINSHHTITVNDKFLLPREII